MCGDVTVTAVELSLQELDNTLNAQTYCGVGDTHALTFAGDYLHELAPGQYQGLQFGIRQRLHKAPALGMWMQHAGKGNQHPGVQRVGSGQNPYGACEARVDYRHSKLFSLQRARCFRLVAARGLQRHQLRHQ